MKVTITINNPVRGTVVNASERIARPYPAPKRPASALGTFNGSPVEGRITSGSGRSALGAVSYYLYFDATDNRSYYVPLSRDEFISIPGGTFAIVSEVPVVAPTPVAAPSAPVVSGLTLSEIDAALAAFEADEAPAPVEAPAAPEPVAEVVEAAPEPVAAPSKRSERRRGK